ncbi:hypothetical protein [Brachyspira hampsonii]|uniref:hypothetical protein n=1 Tax=Brachyspira hampsonii TaxID=1287055 RepID=UPI000D384BB5|nr:hypothetical protein [Brachyspira hampsonii]PTY40500.1 hypothetical protein DQ06_07950 [Brachyspira hampsonii bv. II]
MNQIQKFEYFESEIVEKINKELSYKTTGKLSANLMTNAERKFVNGIIRTIKPKKILRNRSSCWRRKCFNIKFY